jgi:hypothetical protein
MALPIVLLLAAGAGAYFLMQPGKPKSTGAAALPAGATPPVIVPATALPVPPGGVPAEQMQGGQPTVLITPPATGPATPAQTPQQILTAALPNLLTQYAPQPTESPTVPAIKTVPAPGETKVPTAAAPAQTPQQVVTQGLPAAAQQILTQALPALMTATPLQTAETHPELDPNGTIALAKLLIDREASAGWKSANQAEIKAWQGRLGVAAVGKADGLFGEKSALGMAKEVGVLPLIRYWPASIQKGTEVPKHQKALRTYAATVATSNPAHAIALNNSAAFDVGQGFATNPPAIPVSARQGQADLLSQILKQ